MEAPVIAGIAFNRDEAKLTWWACPTTQVWPIAFWAL